MRSPRTRHRLNVELDPVTDERLAMAVERTELSLTKYIRRALRRSLDADGFYIREDHHGRQGHKSAVA